MDLKYYILVTNLRKVTDRSHFLHNTNPHKSGNNYLGKKDLLEKLDYNNICYKQLYENDNGVIRDNLLLVICQPSLEERLKDLINISIFNVMMKADNKDF